MGVIRVDAAQLQSRMEELENLNRQFKSEVDGLETQATTLKSMWEGEANDAFNNAFNNDKVQMNNFYNAVEMYVMRLGNILSRYQNAEATNTSIGNTRTYR